MLQPYLFTSDRLGFRNWKSTDLDTLADINADEEVMQYFPATQNRERTQQFIDRMQKQFAERGYCYFAVEKLTTNEVIGFIGLAYQSFEAPFTPCVDIGWRLAKRHWNQGYATEGAKRCLQHAFLEVGLDSICATAAAINLPSIQVMKKIGLQFDYEFEHPKLLNFDRIRNCVFYSVDAETYQKQLTNH
ncbi:MAG: GNAT family N-acetyltransferase [Saprospiraceae bacterium]|nr:GNAT family N-acetyltransferase [Saprospiraceae bacterium]